MNLVPSRELEIVLLSPRFHLAPFDSGDDELNDFLKNDAMKEQRQLLSKTQLCFYKDKVAGFITLAADSIRIMKDKLDRSQIIDDCDYPAYPCILIARLAVDRRLQGYGVGSHLLSLAIGFVLEAPLGCRYLAVDPKDGARGFYEMRGFKYWTKSMRRMYLNMRDVARQLEPDESIGLWSDGND